MKVIIHNDVLYNGRQGEVVAVVKQSYVDGTKRKCRTEYIIQFDHPKEWNYFRRDTFKQVKKSRR